jgi:hypothetical protein
MVRGHIRGSGDGTTGEQPLRVVAVGAGQKDYCAGVTTVVVVEAGTGTGSDTVVVLVVVVVVGGGGVLTTSSLVQAPKMAIEPMIKTN